MTGRRRKRETAVGEVVQKRMECNGLICKESLSQMNKGAKVGGRGQTKGDERVRRGKGVQRRESPFPIHLDLLFQE